MVRKIAPLVLLGLLVGQQLNGWGYSYKEQFYSLYHRELYTSGLDAAENVRWLELADRAQFANPRYALATIESERQYEKYQKLFSMHINLSLVEAYLLWATRFTNTDIRFYDAHWAQLNAESLQRSKVLYDIALEYWYRAIGFASEAALFLWENIDEQPFWENQLYRIRTGELDYGMIIQGHLNRIAEAEQVLSNQLRQE